MFHGLVTALLKKVQYSYNAEQLESADDESFDDEVRFWFRRNGRSFIVFLKLVKS